MLQRAEIDAGEAMRARVSRLSAIIITKNEAANIAACLASVAFCDERIVVDSGSTDDTIRLAGDNGARVVERPWQGLRATEKFCVVAGDRRLGVVDRRR